MRVGRERRVLAPVDLAGAAGLDDLPTAGPGCRLGSYSSKSRSTPADGPGQRPRGSPWRRSGACTSRRRRRTCAGTTGPSSRARGLPGSRESFALEADVLARRLGGLRAVERLVGGPPRRRRPACPRCRCRRPSCPERSRSFAAAAVSGISSVVDGPSWPMPPGLDRPAARRQRERRGRVVGVLDLLRPRGQHAVDLAVDAAHGGPSCTPPPGRSPSCADISTGRTSSVVPRERHHERLVRRRRPVMDVVGGRARRLHRDVRRHAAVRRRGLGDPHVERPVARARCRPRRPPRSAPRR